MRQPPAKHPDIIVSELHVNSNRTADFMISKPEKHKVTKMYLQQKQTIVTSGKHAVLHTETRQVYLMDLGEGLGLVDLIDLGEGVGLVDLMGRVLD